MRYIPPLMLERILEPILVVKGYVKQSRSIIPHFNFVRHFEKLAMFVHCEVQFHENVVETDARYFNNPLVNLVVGISSKTDRCAFHAAVGKEVDHQCVVQHLALILGTIEMLESLSQLPGFMKYLEPFAAKDSPDDTGVFEVGPLIVLQP